MAYTFDLKTDVKVYITYKDPTTGAYTEPDALPKVTIADDETTYVDGVEMVEEAVGKYYYWWETSSIERGIYNVSVEAEFSSHTVTESTTCELV